MSTQTSVPSQPSQQPSQQQVDAAAQHLEQAPSVDRQGQLNRQTQADSQRHADAAQQQAQGRKDAIQQAAQSQKAIVAARNEEVRQGDHVVVDLDRIPVEMHTVSLRDRLRELFQRGAHQMTGRVQRIEDTPHGREAVVETSSATYNVPLMAAVRADLYEA